MQKTLQLLFLLENHKYKTKILLLKIDISFRDFVENSLDVDLPLFKTNDLEDFIAPPRVQQSFVFANVYEDPYLQEFKHKCSIVDNNKVS